MSAQRLPSGGTSRDARVLVPGGASRDARVLVPGGASRDAQRLASGAARRFSGVQAPPSVSSAAALRLQPPPQGAAR
ncbi:hypothetical protein GCM10010328_34870 [Streptomyces rubiginosohelvolus]|uniref:Uncharacterized protein n=1 Tax=Streptomyces rubiginosohelvolus TaxID=67362 RepID=A0ABQ3BXC4_9ACTN|nr:hypothetical protein GCM10010328_34870 [Streptomyces pluricolorescens]